MGKKKILFFIGGSYISGLEVVTLHLIRGLKEQGYTIECIINGWNNGNFKERLELLDIPYHEIKLGWLYVKKPLWTIDSLIHYPMAFFKCWRVIKIFKPDICHFCGFATPILIYPLIKVKSVFNLQESLMPSKKHLLIFKALDRKISIFTAVSMHIVNVLEKLDIPSAKIKLVYNGIPQPKLLSNPHHPITHLGIIGQVGQWKGHHNLILAVEKLVQNSIVNFKVLIYGNDLTDYGNKMKKIIREKNIESFFSWEGFVKDQEAIYPNCDVVIVPTLTGEPCSLTIIESMFHQKALIVSDRGGNSELINNGKSGLVFEADDVSELYQCIIKLINDRGYQQQLALNAYKVAVANYNYSNMTNQYIDIYEKL